MDGKKILIEVRITTSLHRGWVDPVRDLDCVDGVVILYDITSEPSLESTIKWDRDLMLDKYPRNNIQAILLVGSKSDLTNNRSVQFDAAKSFAERRLHELCINTLEISSKDNLGVDQIFEALAEAIIPHFLTPKKEAETILLSGGYGPKRDDSSKCCIM